MSTMGRRGLRDFAMVSLAIFLLVTFSLAEAKATCGDEIRCDTVSPKEAGKGGGVPVTITGCNLMGGFNLNNDINTKVTLSNHDNSYPCEVHKGFLSEGSLTCYTSEMKPGDYDVSIEVDGDLLKPENIKPGCALTVAGSKTPIIKSVTVEGRSQIHGSGPGKIVEVKGKIFTTYHGSATLQQNSTNGVTAKINRVRIGGELCNLGLPTNGEPSNITLDAPNSYYGEFKCQMETRFVSGHNVSFMVEAPYGRAETDIEILHVGRDGIIFVLEVYAEISSLSSNKGGDEGGTLEVLTGTGLSDETKAPMKVMVGGVTADIIEKKDNATVISTPKKSAITDTYFTGNRGCFTYVYASNTSIADISDAEAKLNDAANTINQTWSDVACYSHPSDKEEFFAAKMVFYFIPSETGDYILDCRGSAAGCKVYLSETDKDPTQKVEANLAGHSNRFRPPGDVSGLTTYTLTKDESYYMEIIFYGEAGQEMCGITYSLNALYNEGQAAEHYNERQKISIESDFKPITETIEFGDVTSDPSAVVADVQSFQHDPAVDGDFRIKIAGISTSMVDKNIGSDEIVSTLNKDLMVTARALNCKEIKVETSTEAGCTSNCYRLTIDSTLGPFEPAVMVFEDGSTRLADVETPGVSDGNNFILQYGGVRSGIIPPNATEEQVKSEMLSLLSVRSGWNDPLGIPEPKLFEDFEEDSTIHTWGTRDCCESFLGRCCIRTSNGGGLRLYNRDSTRSELQYRYPIDIAKKFGMGGTKLFFAYLGRIKNCISIKIEYKRKGDKNTRWWWPCIGFNNTVHSKWASVRINLTDELEKRISGDIDRLKLHRVVVYSNSKHPNSYLFVDTFVLDTTQDLKFDDLPNRLLPPPFRVAHVDVAKNGSSYKITLSPCGCYVKSSGFDVPVGAASTVTLSEQGSGAVGGTFGLTSNGKTIDIPADIGWKELESRLKNYFGCHVHVVLGRTCANRTFTLEWNRCPGSQPLTSVDGSALTGNNPRIAAVREQSGGHVKNFTGDYIVTAHDTPQVVAIVNGATAKCEGDCTFIHDSSHTPTVTAFSPQNGHKGTSITITGTLFSSELGNNIVYFGSSLCGVDSVSADGTELICTLGPGDAGTFDVSLRVKGDKGMAVVTASTFTYDLHISSITPTEGAVGGCTMLTIYGSGFKKGLEVTVGGNQCTIEQVSPGNVTCKVPVGAMGAVDVAVTNPGVTPVQAPTQYTYGVDDEPSITSISHTEATAYGGALVTINGINLKDPSAETSVFIGQEPADIIRHESDIIVVELPELSQDDHSVQVYVLTKGCALMGGVLPTIEVKFKISDICPKSASPHGGTLITIEGEGFPTTDADKHKVTILVGDMPCKITGILAATRMTCLLPEHREKFTVEYSGEKNDHRWVQDSIDVEVGDLVKWTCKPLPQLRHEIRVIETDCTTGEILENGLKKDCKNNEISHVFTEEKTFCYTSGYIDGDDENIKFDGKVIVSAKQAKDIKLTVKTSGKDAIEALYAKDGSVTCSATCPQVKTVPALTCATLTNSPDQFLVKLDPCYRPIITGISNKTGTSPKADIDSPMVVYAHTELIITGSGFGTDPACVQVKVGDYDCVPVSGGISDTEIRCKIDTLNTMLPGIYSVSINRMNNGYFASPLFRVQYKPFVNMISPLEGSLAGGMILTVEGSALDGIAKAPAVGIGVSACTITEKTYASIECETPGMLAEKTEEIVVYSDGWLVDSADDYMFSWTAAKTSKILSVHPNSTSGPTTMTVEGDNFGNAPVVHMGKEPCAVTGTPTATEIECQLEHLELGDHPVSVFIPSQGKARNDASVKVKSLPAFSAISPSVGSIHGFTAVTATGNGFVLSDIDITINGKPCTNVQGDPGSVTCDTPANPEGTYDVVIKSGGVTFPTGLAFEYKLSNTPVVNSLNPAIGTKGTVVSLAGSGFSSTAADNIVTFGDEVADDVEYVDAATLKATAPSNEAGGKPVAVRVKGVGASNKDVMFEQELRLDSLSETEGSHEGGQDLIAEGSGLQGWTFMVSGIPCEELTNLPNGKVSCRTPPSGLQSGTKATEVTITSGQKVVRASYTYTDAKTPYMTSISPRRGGSAGGTDITIIGYLFGTDPTKVSVLINGRSPCIVLSVTDTQLVCRTGSSSACVFSSEKNVKVTRAGYGAALDKIADTDPRFQYEDFWDSTYTWSQDKPTDGTIDTSNKRTIPRDGEFVLIPKNATCCIILETETAKLKFLLIEGCLELRDGAILHAEYILINNGGILKAGTEDKPAEGKIQIILYGHQQTQTLPIFGSKVLAVRNGTLSLHGQPVGVTWTSLGFTASPGDTTITLKSPVLWSTGDEIVIATTGDHLSQKETEVRTITAKSADGLTLTLDRPLEYLHLGITETYCNGNGQPVTVEYRAAVGLLTRSIVLRGYLDRRWERNVTACKGGATIEQFKVQSCFEGRHGDELIEDEFGMTIMCSPAKKDSHEAVCKLSYVEIKNAGQAFQLGRYPVHFHHLGNTDSYVMFCAIHHTNNRAINIHNTHNVRVRWNVLYFVRGGAIFLEDGIESGNILEYNLVVFVISSSSLLTDDITPAGFWITFPFNTVRHNWVVGGTHFGFWYRFNLHPDGSSVDVTIWPRSTALGTFYNNTVNSVGWYGLWVFEFYFPPVPARFDSFFAYNCFRGAEWVECGMCQFSRFILANNFKANSEHYFIKKHGNVNPPRFSRHGAGIFDSVIIGHMNYAPRPRCGIGIILPFATGFLAINITFINYDESGICAALGTVKIICVCDHDCAGYNYEFEQIRYCNVGPKNRANFEWAHQGGLVDRDGTLTETSAANSGKFVATVYPKSPLMSPECTDIEAFSYNYPAVICPNNQKTVLFTFNKVKPSSLAFKDVQCKNAYGISTGKWAKQRNANKEGWIFLLPVGMNYTVSWVNGGQQKNLSYHGTVHDVQEEDRVIFEHELEEDIDRISLVKNKEPVPVEDIETADISGAYNLSPKSQHGQRTRRSTNSTSKYQLKYKVGPEKGWTARAADSKVSEDVLLETGFIKCHFDGCIVPNGEEEPLATERPSGALLWSDEGTWETAQAYIDGIVVGKPSGGADKVVIPKGYWVVLDEDITGLNFKTIEIFGVLEVDPSLVTTLQFTYIVIRRTGRFIAGFPDDLFTGNLILDSIGTHSTPSFPRKDGPNIGSKVIAAFGGLDLHGQHREVSSANLKKTVDAGESQDLELEENVEKAEGGWVAGDEVAFTTTSHSAWQTEIHTITEVKGNKITIAKNLKYKHQVYEDKNCKGDGRNCKLVGRVVLLTRNIKIRGVNEDGSASGGLQETQAFGARILVGQQADDTGEELVAAIGFARITNVEFVKSGQLGWTENYDHRCSLTYHRTQEVNPFKPSYIMYNSFHDGFSPAICVHEASGIIISHNSIHHAVGEGITTNSHNITITYNTVMFTRWPGAYQLVEESNKFFPASIFTSTATCVTLQNNYVAGAERVAYRIDGEADPEDCPGMAQTSEGNVAVGVNIGVALFPDLPSMDGTLEAGSSHITGFTIIRAWGYGIYTQTTNSIRITETVLCENMVGVLTLIIQPDITKHEIGDKWTKIESSTIGGLGEHFDCMHDTVNPNTDDNVRLARVAWGYNYNSVMLKNDDGVEQLYRFGRVGVSFLVHNKITNLWPFKSFHLAKGNPAYHSRLYVTDTCFCNFGTQCRGYRDFMFGSNPINHDMEHAVETRGITMDNCDEDSIVHYLRPNVGQISGADCPTMDCPGKKRILLLDKDGSLLNHVGAAVPDSVFEYNGDLRRGLGDYRIPGAMRINANGDFKQYDELYKHLGIVDAWPDKWSSEGQFYNVEGNYQHLMLENMDSDFMTRRLQPVALYDVFDGWFDIANGPGQRGICGGYACRISPGIYTFILKVARVYRVYFTGSPPQKMRIHFPYTSYSDHVVVCLHNNVPMRLDVFNITKDATGTAKKVHIPAKNAYMDENGELQYHSNDASKNYSVTLSDETGTNYYNHAERLFCVAVRGSNYLHIETSSVVLFSTGVQMTIDEFFGANIVANLVAFLGIPPEKVRIVNVVPENSKRRKRAAEGGYVTMVIELSNNVKPARALDEEDADVVTDWSYDQFDAMYNRLVEGMQTKSLEKYLGVDFVPGTFKITKPLPPSDSEEWTKLVQEAGELGIVAGGAQEIKTPASLELTHHPQASYEGAQFLVPPRLRVKDIYGNTVRVLANSNGVWKASVSLYDNKLAGDIWGSTAVSFKDGWANFTNLRISRVGEYRLQFKLSNPTSFGNITNILTREFTVKPRRLKLKLQLATPAVVVGKSFKIKITAQDLNGQVANNLAWRSHTWSYSISLHPKFVVELGGAGMSGEFQVSGETTTDELFLKKAGRHPIKVKLTSDPPDYVVEGIKVIDVHSPNRIEPVAKVEVSMTLDGDCNLMKKEPGVLEASFYNSLKERLGEDIVVDDLIMTCGSIIVNFTLGGTNASLDQALDSLASYVNTSCPNMVLLGNSLLCKRVLLIDSKPYSEELGKKDEETPGVKPLPHTAAEVPLMTILLGVFIPVGVILIVLVIVLCVVKRANKRSKNFQRSSSLTPDISMNPDGPKPYMDQPPTLGFTQTGATIYDEKLGVFKPAPCSRESSGYASTAGTAPVSSREEVLKRTKTLESSPAIGRAEMAIDTRPEREDSAVSQISKQEFSVGFSPRDINFGLSDIN